MTQAQDLKTYSVKDALGMKKAEVSIDETGCLILSIEIKLDTERWLNREYYRGVIDTLAEPIIKSLMYRDNLKIARIKVVRENPENFPDWLSITDDPENPPFIPLINAKKFIELVYGE